MVIMLLSKPIVIGSINEYINSGARTTTCSPSTRSDVCNFLEAWYSVHQEVLSWGLALGEGSLGLPGQICHQQRLGG